MVELSIIENLFGEVSAEVLMSEKIRNSQDEEFNIFQITKIGEREVDLHSRFIAELLDPRGSHRMGDSFLVHFMKLLCDKIEKNHWLAEAKNFSSIRVDVERNVGSINDDITSGGSIDIFLSFGSIYLIIENKIYASDQNGQLRRYYNAFSDYDSKVAIVYLTLDGRAANEYSTKNNDFPGNTIEPVLLSYKEDIMTWLDYCIKEVEDRPMIRVVISQYINQIKILTNQTSKNQMENQIDKIILKDEQSVKAAWYISASMDRIKQTANRNLDSVQSYVQEFVNGLVNLDGLAVSVQKWHEKDSPGEPTISFFIGKSGLEREIEIMFYYDKYTFKTITEIVSVNLKDVELMSFRENIYSKIGDFSFDFDSDLKLVSESFVRLCNQALKEYVSISFRNK
jgi:hypothetical protein